METIAIGRYDLVKILLESYKKAQFFSFEYQKQDAASTGIYNHGAIPLSILEGFNCVQDYLGGRSITSLSLAERREMIAYLEADPSKGWKPFWNAQSEVLTPYCVTRGRMGSFKLSQLVAARSAGVTYIPR